MAVQRASAGLGEGAMETKQEQRLIFTNARIFTPAGAWNTGWLVTEGARIKLMAPGQPPDFGPSYITRSVDAANLNLLPGFVDIHAHGAVGVDTMDATPQGLRNVARFYAQHGVTAY